MLLPYFPNQKQILGKYASDHCYKRSDIRMLIYEVNFSQEITDAGF